MLGWSGRSGPEWFLFPHTMDIVRWLFDREPVEVYAKGYRGVLEGKGIHCWDAIQAMVEFEGRAFCTFETSWIVPNSVYQRRRQPACRSTAEWAGWSSERAHSLGVHRPLPHAVLVGVGHALRQGVGISVRIDPLLRGLRRRRRPAGGQRTRWPHGDRDDRGDAQVAGGEAAGAGWTRFWAGCTEGRG